MKKRFLGIKSIIAVLCLGAMLIATLSGCSSKDKTEPTTAAPTSSAPVDVMSGPEVKLTMWHSMGGANAAALEELTNQFNTKFAGHVNVALQFQGAYDDALNKLKSAEMSGSGPDIAQVFELGTRFMLDSGWITPVQNYIDKEKWDIKQIEPNLAAYYTINGKLNSMPFNSSTPLLYYNKNAFKAAGLDPENPPKTFDEIIALNDKLKTPDRSTFGMHVYGWWFDESLNKLGLPQYDNGNGRTGAPTKVVFDSNGGGLKFLQTYKKLYTSGTMQTWQMVGADNMSGFINGKTAMMTESTTQLVSILTGVAGKFEVGTGFYPAIDKDSKGGMSIGGASLWMMKNKDPRVEQAVWEFMKFMVQPAQQAYWNTKTGYFPVNVNAANEQVYKDNIAKYPQFGTALKQLRESPATAVGPLCAVGTTARKIQETDMQKMVAGQMTEEQALADMVKQINSAITDYNAANK